MKSFIIEDAESDRLHFRKVTQSDYDAWLPFFYNAESTRFLGTFDGTNEERCQSWIDRMNWRYDNDNGLMALIDKTTGALVGQCGLLKQTIDGVDEIEIGYHLLPQYRRMGYAGEAAIFCKHFAFDNHLTDTVISLIHPQNNNSMAVARKNGMQLEKQSSYRDITVNVFRVTNPATLSF
ncbi:MAG: GNAT family N-acetyltransferase [Bacteroidetes bacterium]|nr:MAG: GNAT family N-acetyltransferase [Bacteroidota bacterium]